MADDDELILLKTALYQGVLGHPPLHRTMSRREALKLFTPTKRKSKYTGLKYEYIRLGDLKRLWTLAGDP